MRAFWPFILLAASSAAPGGDLAQPAGKWMVATAPTYCRASRAFTDGQTRFVLKIDVAPTQATELWSVEAPRPTQSRPARDQNTGSVKFAPSGDEMRVPMFSRDRDGLRETSFVLQTRKLSTLKQSDAVKLEAEGVERQLPLTSMSVVVQALEDCERTLLRTWSVDPASVAAVPPQPKGDGPAAWFGADAYPAEAAKSGIQGVSTIGLLIDESGRVTACRIVASSGDASLDRAACKPVLGHSKSFSPASDKDGKTVAADFIMPVSWTSPQNSSEAQDDAPFGIVVTSR